MSKQQKGPGKVAREKSTLNSTLIKIEEKRQRDFVKEKLHPYLLQYSKNIKDAEDMLYVCKTALETAFNKKILTYQIQMSAEMVPSVDYMDGLQTIITDNEDRKRFEGLLKLFENEKISTAQVNLDGMKKVYEGFVAEEINGRALSTLKTDFL